MIAIGTSLHQRPNGVEVNVWPSPRKFIFPKNYIIANVLAAKLKCLQIEIIWFLREKKYKKIPTLKVN